MIKYFEAWSNDGLALIYSIGGKCYVCQNGEIEYLPRMKALAKRQLTAEEINFIYQNTPLEDLPLLTSN